MTRTPSCPIAIPLFFSCFVTFAIGILFDPAGMARPDNLDERARHVAWADWGSNYGRRSDRKAHRGRFLINQAEMPIRIEQVRLERPADSGVR